VLVGADIGFLNNILDLRVIFDDRPHSPEQPLVVPPHEDFHQRDVATQHPAYNLVVSQGSIFDFRP